jgi:hypothetical protein
MNIIGFFFECRIESYEKRKKHTIYSEVAKASKLLSLAKLDQNFFHTIYPTFKTNPIIFISFDLFLLRN